MGQSVTLEKISLDEARTINFPVVIDGQGAFKLFHYLTRSLGEGCQFMGSFSGSYEIGDTKSVLPPGMTEHNNFESIRGQIRYFTMIEKHHVLSNFSLIPGRMGTFLEGFKGLVFDIPEGVKEWNIRDVSDDELELYGRVGSNVDYYFNGPSNQAPQKD